MLDVPPTRLARLGAASARHPWRFVVVWLLLTLAAFAVAVGGVSGQSLFERLNTGAPSAPGEATRAADILRELDPQLQSLTLQVDGADLAATAAVTAATTATRALAATPGVTSVRSPLLVPGGVTSPAAATLLADGRPTSRGFVTVVALSPSVDTGVDTGGDTLIRERMRAVAAPFAGATARVSGTQDLITAVTSQIEKDLRFGEGIALPLSFLVMFVVFGGFVAAGMPVAGAVVSIGGALASLWVFSHVIDLDASVVNVVTLLGLGLSIDYGLLTVSRYREELTAITADKVARGQGTRRLRFTDDDIVTATARTVATAGRTVLFSGLTVAIALSGLLTFDAQIMRAIGSAGVSVVLVALVVDLTLLPALCALGARRLAGRRRGVEASGDTGVFSRLAHGVQRRPVIVSVASVAVLLALAAPALSMRLTGSTTQLLPVGNPARVFFDDLDRGYPAFRSPDLTVVAHAPITEAEAYARTTVSRIKGVTGATARALSPTLTAVSVAVSDGPTGPLTDGVITSLRDNRPAFTTEVTGRQAGQRDFLTAMRAGAPYAIALVVLGTFVLLFLMTGSLVLPLKALLLNVVSLGAALGSVVLVFQDGHLEGILQFTSVGAVESVIPFLAIAFGFGLSMDYEVFLLARVAELYRAGHPNNESVSLGLQRSGRIITSAALLVIIVFGGFVAGQLLVIKEIGFALVVAVALDATLVRMLLVPATMTLLGRWNWWAPAPLARWHARHGITE
ncbi:MMPL family transporter [Dermatophilaceae bacterium Soc4.6]